jgi:hypothetical protein
MSFQKDRIRLIILNLKEILLLVSTGEEMQNNKLDFTSQKITLIYPQALIKLLNIRVDWFSKFSSKFL